MLNAWEMINTYKTSDGIHEGRRSLEEQGRPILKGILKK